MLSKIKQFAKSTRRWLFLTASQCQQLSRENKQDFPKSSTLNCKNIYVGIKINKKTSPKLHIKKHLSVLVLAKMAVKSKLIIAISFYLRSARATSVAANESRSAMTSTSESTMRSSRAASVAATSDNFSVSCLIVGLDLAIRQDLLHMDGLEVHMQRHSETHRSSIHQQRQQNILTFCFFSGIQRLLWTPACPNHAEAGRQKTC